jgi:hypothetical protein
VNLTLRRTSFTKFGVFGILIDDKGSTIAYTLEHAYGDRFQPKLPDGTYTCRRGMHRLMHMRIDFETFEIENVPGHEDILFHTGNTNEDSSGCVLLGEKIGIDFLLRSRAAFISFMELQKGLDTFQLTVKT